MIEVNNLNKSFGAGNNKVHVLKDINLTIEKGEFIAIVGQSGSGKSTLMNLLGCLDTPSSGSYKIDDTETSSLESNELADLRSKRFGFIFQRYNLLANLTALDNVALPAVYLGKDHKERITKATSLLTDLGLQDKIYNKPNELSGGQQQRVSIARALMNGGEIILADEPTGALDSKSGETVMEILKKLHRQGHTIILVTHDKHIASYADRTIELKDGYIISDQITNTQHIASIDHKKITTQYSPFIFYKDQLIESLKMSIQAITAHKLRSILTMLGIIIGIASVVSVVALGQGSQQKILADINAMGTNITTIYPGSGIGDMFSGRIKTLTDDDANELLKLSFLDGASPTVSTSGTVVYKNISVSVQMTGVNEYYFRIKGQHIAMGRFFNKEDILSNNSVIVISSDTQQRLFPSEDPIGKVILFNKQPFEIIGVTEPNRGLMMTNSLDIWAPYTTASSKIIGSTNISSIVVKFKDEINPQIANMGITKFLTIKHQKQDFYTTNLDAIRQAIESTTNTMTLLISCIALISLIVGGIGVMNIMLVSVTERTKEIGIRMAIGAREYSILEQFLIEAILICLIGGGLGIILSYLIGFTFNNLFTEFPMIFSLASVILALVCSTAIGIIFGFLPARNASKLNPIVALSRE